MVDTGAIVICPWPAPVLAPNLAKTHWQPVHPVLLVLSSFQLLHWWQHYADQLATVADLMMYWHTARIGLSHYIVLFNYTNVYLF